MSPPFQKPPPQQPRVTTSAPSPRQEQPHQESIPSPPRTLRFHFTPMHGLIAVGVLLILAVFWYAMSGPTVPKPFAFKIDGKKFEGVYRATKSVEGATTVGVNYRRFGELLQALATELVIAGDKVTEHDEKMLLALYANAAQIYVDSHTLWKHKNVEGFIFVDGEVRQIAEEYGLPTESAGRGEYVVSERSIQLLWTKAEKQPKVADSLRNWPPKPQS